MSANPHTNGGVVLRDLEAAGHFRAYAVETPAPGVATAEATRVMGTYLRDVMQLNLRSPQYFASFSPDESNSNRWVAGRARGHQPRLGCRNLSL